MDKYLVRREVFQPAVRSGSPQDAESPSSSRNDENSQTRCGSGKCNTTKSLDHETETRPDESAPSSTTTDIEPSKKPTSKSIMTWKAKYSWITYHKDKNCIFCELCCEAVSKALPLPSDRKALISKKAFVEDGSRTFKNAPGIFDTHEKSGFHQAARGRLEDRTKINIANDLTEAYKEEKLKNRKALNAIFTSVLFLTRQGLAIRGHEEENSNLRELLKLRADDIPELKMWLERKNHRWLHHSIIDEMINICADDVRCRNFQKIKENVDFGLLADESCDISKSEQVSIGIRSVDEDLTVNEYFIEFVDTPNTKSETLENIVYTSIEKGDLNIHDCKGQCYDGASNVSGRISGLQSRVRQTERRALYVHCSAHNLSLSVQDSLEDIPEVRNTVGLIKDQINFIRDSPKRLNEFQDIQPEGSSNLVQFCPTRFTVRVKSLKSIYDERNYISTMQFMEEKANDRKIDCAIAARARGFLTHLETFEFYFILSVVIIIFDQVEALNTELQKQELCINQSHALVRSVLENLSKMRDDNIFHKIWTDVTADASNLGVDDPVLKRQRKVPQRYENDSRSTSHTFSTPEEQYRKTYYEIIDKAVTSLETRFDSETMKLLDQFENFIFGRGVQTSVIINFYNSEAELRGGKIQFDERKLERERDILLSTLTSDEDFKSTLNESGSRKRRKVAHERYLETGQDSDGENLNFGDLVSYLKKRPELRKIFPQMTRLVRIMLTIPGSSCTNERSFSAMRRIKNYTRASMGQKRLNDTTLLFIYSNMIKKSNMDKYLDKFILANPYRSQVFALSL